MRLATAAKNLGIIMMLMRAVWPDAYVEENNLNQNVSALRRALGESRGENRYIATVPGRSYPFVADVTAPVRDEATREGPRTVALLPFKPVEVNRDEALELGMADTLIARLGASGAVVRPLAKVDVRQGRYEDAIARLERAEAASFGASETISMAGYAWALAGERAKALAALDRLSALSAERYVPPLNVAMVHDE